MPSQLMRAIYYRAADGSEPVREFVDGLPIRCQVLLDNQVDLLNRLTTGDPPLAFPHSSQVRGELRELRCHCGRNLYRILYRRSVNLFLLLHIFQKNSAAIPDQEIAITVDRWDDFRARMDAEPRKPPRPAGHDAPARP
jgi:phage-related protein